MREGLIVCGMSVLYVSVYVCCMYYVCTYVLYVYMYIHMCIRMHVCGICICNSLSIIYVHICVRMSHGITDHFFFPVQVPTKYNGVGLSNTQVGGAWWEGLDPRVGSTCRFM